MYISRSSGNDSWSCDQSKPCKSIWRAVTLASREDRIHLDGSNTDKDPYTCQSGKPDHPGIYINKSLSLIGYASPMPQIRCSEGTGLTFNGSDDAQQMNVTLSGLLVNESFVSVQDNSVNIAGCKFEGSKQGLEFVIRTKIESSIQITNSTFLKNRECIAVVVNSTKNPSQSIQVMFKLTNSSFDGNVLSDEGRCISFTESLRNNKSVSCDITLQNVSFTRNKFSSKGLVFLEMTYGNQNVHLQHVTSIHNSPSYGRDVLTNGSGTECIVRSTAANIFVESSHFTSHHTQAFNVSARKISMQIHNSSFYGHRVEGDGGVLSLRGADVCRLNVTNSSFVNTTAAQGGAINMECAKVNNVSFHDNIFTDNTASNRGGGAVYIDAFGSVLNDTEYAINDKGEVVEQGGLFLLIDINRCYFTNCNSYSPVANLDGGALYIKGLKASVRLNHSSFTMCRTATFGGGIFIQTGSTLPQRRPSYAGVDLLLIVDSSNFTRCRASDGASLYAIYETEMQITINNSHFISNNAEMLGGALCVYPSNTEGENWKRNSGQITIENSAFINNRAFRGGAFNLESNSQTSLILQRVVMESNGAEEDGGAAVINKLGTMVIRKSRFLNNRGESYGGVFSMVDVHILNVADSFFESNSAWSSSGGAFVTQSRLTIQSITIIHSEFNNCSAGQLAGAIYLKSEGHLSLVIKKSRFTRNQEYSFGGGGALFLSLASDSQTDPGCNQKTFTSNNPNYDVKKYPSWDYKSNLFIEDTTFERNGASLGGAVCLRNGGKATFNNCSFIDNFARLQGGHIYSGDGSTSLVIQDSLFKRNIKNLQLLSPYDAVFTKASFIHAESSGKLTVYNTTMDFTPYGNIGPLIEVANGGLVDLGNNNLTKFTCPVGSQLQILNFTELVTTHVNNTPCKIKLTTLVFSCLVCPGNSYSLQRGHVIGSELAPGFKCLPCPFGANCSQNILAKPNFWGFNNTVNPPTLKFTMCPVGYCRPPETTDFPEYNGCQGNRSGELCGECNESYTETLYSTNCRPSHECTDYWFWPVALLYVSLMALYFTFKPPVVPWIKRQILWFKNHDPASEDNNFDKGYIKVIFYFYQAANLLLVSNSSQNIFKAKFIEPLVGLFNFQQKFSSDGLFCPFSGLTVVTKQLFSASHVFGTLLMIGIFYILHCGVQKCRGQGAPSVGPYIGGILQTMLLGYTTLASVSFNLLRCLPIGSEKRLFYDGNVVCFQWWQYVLIAFMCTFFVPFVFALLWGSFKLHNRTISIGEFLLACSLPLPYLLYWTFVSLFSRPKNACAGNEDSSSSQLTRSSVERVLYDSFKRPDDGRTLSVSWESVMIGRRLIVIVLKAFVSDPMPRLLVMSFFCFLFLLHHALTQPFRNGIANAVETISLLSLGLLANVNTFFASFLSLAVPLNDHFTSWWNACQVVEIVILCAVPAVFGLLVVTAVLSQVCRLTVVVCRFLFHLFCVCFSWCSRKQDDETRPLLAPVS